MFELSQDKQKIIRQLYKWYNSSEKRSFYVTLGGYAGTGKTTLIAFLREKLHQDNEKLKIAFVSYTGKAARVLRNRLKEHKAIHKQDSVDTIHSLVYSPIVNDREEITGWKRKDKIKANLIIIDEASMVDYAIWQDLTEYGIPIIAVGDHGQLPPINGSFNLMAKPHLKLETIHRQARENPIIELSIQAREHGSILPGNYGPSIRKINKQSDEYQEIVGELLENFNLDTLILCGYNSTRVKLNQHIREIRGFENPEPSANDRVICLRNNHQKNIFNGMLGSIHHINKENDDWFYAEIAMDGEENMFKGLISAKQFNAPKPMNFGKKRSQIMRGDLFDFGYALTVHKAQGSQATRVILFEERFKQMDDQMWKKWLYTAVTRAEKELFIIGK